MFLPPIFPNSGIPYTLELPTLLTDLVSVNIVLMPQNGLVVILTIRDHGYG